MRLFILSSTKWGTSKSACCRIYVHSGTKRFCRPRLQNHMFLLTHETNIVFILPCLVHSIILQRHIVIILCHFAVLMQLKKRRRSKRKKKMSTFPMCNEVLEKVVFVINNVSENPLSVIVVKLRPMKLRFWIPSIGGSCVKQHWKNHSSSSLKKPFTIITFLKCLWKTCPCGDTLVMRREKISSWEKSKEVKLIYSLICTFDLDTTITKLYRPKSLPM